MGIDSIYPIRSKVKEHSNLGFPTNCCVDTLRLLVWVGGIAN